MNQGDLIELLAAAQVRQLAIELHKKETDKFSHPPTPGNLDWLRTNPVESFIPKAVEELQNVAAIMRRGGPR